MAPYNPKAAWHRSLFQSLADHFDFTLDTPFGDLPPEVLNALLRGSTEPVEVRYRNQRRNSSYRYTTRYRGILNDLRRALPREFVARREGVAGAIHAPP